MSDQELHYVCQTCEVEVPYTEHDMIRRISCGLDAQPSNCEECARKILDEMKKGFCTNVHGATSGLDMEKYYMGDKAWAKQNRKRRGEE